MSKMTAETLPYNAAAAAGDSSTTEVVNQAAFVGVGLLGMCRHDPKDGVLALHDWTAAETLYVAAHSSLRDQVGADAAKAIVDRIRGQLHANGWTRLHDCYGKRFPVLPPD